MYENDAACSWLGTIYLLNLKLTSWITVCSNWIMISDIYTTVTMSHCVKSHYHHFLISQPLFMSLTLNVDRFTIIYCLQMRRGRRHRRSWARTRRQGEGDTQLSWCWFLVLQKCHGKLLWFYWVIAMVEHQQHQCQEVVGQRIQCADIWSVGGKVMRKLLFGREGQHYGDWQYRGAMWVKSSSEHSVFV